MRYLFIVLYFLPVIASGQPCSANPGMSPSTAIAVCGSSVFQQSSVANCTGPTNIPHTGCSSPVTTANSYWYKFHCFQAGTLAFTIRATVPGDDFDWELFDITGAPSPDVVLTNASYQLSLNLFGNTAAVPNTGCSASGVGNVNCEGPTNAFNAMPNLVAGNDYLLMVTNYSASGNGYSLSFNGGTAVITDPIPPAIDHVETGCDVTKLQVFFTKDIRCQSVTASGSEFTIMPGNIPVSSVTAQCPQTFNSITQLTVNLPALAAGNYILVVNNGTDGNTFNDACNNSLAAGSSIPFSVVGQAPGSISNITFAGCAPTVFTVKLTKPVFCSSLTPTGSEFSITPGNPAIASVISPDCASGSTYTKTIQITLQNPLPFNNYQLLLGNGTDGNTLIDTCNTAMSPSSTPFTISSTPAPVIQSIDFNECHPDQLALNFDKGINCNSLSANGSEFTINPGNIPIASITSNCIPGSYTSQVIVYLQSALPAGNFSVNVNNGSDGNTISDTCFSFIAAGYSKSFVTTQAPLPIFDSVVYNKCNPSTIRAYYSKPIKCATVSADGSDFTISGPSAVTITSAATDPANCTLGYTNWIDLQLAQPINLTGNYLLHNKVGTDGNGIIDTCSAAQSTTETIPFTAFAKPSAAFTNQVLLGCTNDTIRLAHPGGNGVNVWTWNMSDNTTASGQNVTHLFPVSTVTAVIQLIVSNGQCPDTSTVTITLNNAYQASFTTNITDTTCLGNPVSFTNTSTGSNFSYQWQFGDNSSFNGQTAPNHLYTTPGDYSISLIGTNNIGCSDTARHPISIEAKPQIDFGTLNPNYCSGENVQLTANLQGNISNYVWDNGDGKTFTNKSQINFSYANEKSYSITLSATDRFCGQVQKIKTTQVFLVPVVALGNDTTFCPGLSTIIGPVSNPAYSYLWSTGAITSQISTDQVSKTYKLTVSNNGCNASDDIVVKVLLTCLIKVPNAFTPNGDGLNDLLKAINADLATNFSLSVYNRFGQRIFFTRNPLKGWDGTYKGQPAETGAYVWQLNYTDPVSGKIISQSGSSLLLR